MLLILHYTMCIPHNNKGISKSGSATENSILLSVLPILNKRFNQSINQSECSYFIHRSNDNDNFKAYI